MELRFSNSLQRQSGFTLIEALIAFVVLSVGIVGALLFHSNLLKESSDNKARIEAVKIAERLIEEQRRNLYGSNASLAAAMSTLDLLTPYQITGTHEVYTIDWSSSGTVSGATDVYNQSLNVSWGSGESVNLATFYSYMDFNKTINPDDVGTGSGGEYDGSIPLPTGTLSAVERLELLDPSIVSGAESVAGDGQLLKYVDPDTGEDRVAIQLDENTVVQLAKLSGPQNEIFTISGEIYNLDPPNRMLEKFDDVYEVRDADGKTLTYNYDIIDVRASAGANCIITDFENSGSVGLWARYVCVAGTGWNGYVYPFLRVEDPKTVSDYDLELLTAGNLVCAPRQRNYRYYTIALENAANGGVSPETFSDDFIPLIGASQSATSILGTVSGALVGQSGLVRFYKDQDSVDLSVSGEGIVWADYFWQNPNYIVSPGWTSISSSEAYAVVSTDASGGYKVPSFITASAGAYSINFPGDIAYQNFFLANTKDKDATVTDCDSVIGQAQTEAFATAAGPLENGFLLEYGTPGYYTVPSVAASSESEFGYIPSGAVAAGSYYGSQDYNFYDWDEIVKTTGKKTSIEYIEATRGSIILGYVLATETVQGRLGISSTLAFNGITIENFDIVGNPEPTASIVCSKATDGEVDESYTYYDFSCPVPKGWTGRVVAHLNTSPISNAFACNRFTDNDIESLPYWITPGEYFSSQEDGSVGVSNDEDGLKEELGFYVLEEFLSGTLTTSTAYESFVSRSSAESSGYQSVAFEIVSDPVFQTHTVDDIKFEAAKCAE